MNIDMDMDMPLKTDTELFNRKDAAALKQNIKVEFNGRTFIMYGADNDTVLFNRVEAALKQDNKDAFVSLIKDLSSEKHILDIYSKMFYYDRVACFDAMLAGEAGKILNTDYLLSREKNFPLHGAARMLQAPKITALLLEKGYDADLRTDYASMDVCLENALPLNVALETYCAYEWKGGSAVQLITSFCGSTSASKDTIATLARNTKEIKLEFYEYLEQGMMVEVGILLTVASDRIMSEAEDAISFKDISEMCEFVSNEIDEVSGDATLTQLERDEQLLDMQMTLELLAIFDNIGVELITQTKSQLPRSELLSLIKNAGFDVDNTHSERSFHVNVVEGGLDDESPSSMCGILPTVPSTSEERELCYQAYKSGEWTKNPVSWSVSVLPSRITVTVDRTWFTEKQVMVPRASGIEV